MVDVSAQSGGGVDFSTQCVPASDADGDFRLAKFLGGADIPYDLTGAPVGLVTEDVPFDTEPDSFADAPLRAFWLDTLEDGVTSSVTISFDLGASASAIVGTDVPEPLYATPGDPDIDRPVRDLIITGRLERPGSRHHRSNSMRSLRPSRAARSPVRNGPRSRP